MKLVAISDTHGMHEQIKLPPGDMIIHAGDCLNRGSQVEAEEFIAWYGALNYKHKILVPGNHDWYFESYQVEARALCKAHNVILLIDEDILLDGIKLYGSPQTPWFLNWAFNKARNEAERAQYGVGLIKPYCDAISEDTDILITHGPPYDILDETHTACGEPTGWAVGCVDLAERIKEIKPDIHIFGHIHASHGERHIDGISYYNVAICDETYYPSNAVTEIQYSKES